MLSFVTVTAVVEGGSIINIGLIAGPVSEKNLIYPTLLPDSEFGFINSAPNSRSALFCVAEAQFAD